MTNVLECRGCRLARATKYMHYCSFTNIIKHMILTDSAFGEAATCSLLALITAARNIRTPEDTSQQLTRHKLCTCTICC